MPNLTYRSHDDMIASWPGPWTVGLLTAAPNPDGTGVLEPSTSDGYARQPMTYDKSHSEGITTLANNSPMIYGPATNPWVTVNYFGLFDANGVLRMYGRLRTARDVQSGKTESFAAGSIAVRLR